MSLWNAERTKQGGESPIGMQIPGSQRHGALAVSHQSTGGCPDRCQPIGDILWVADGGRQQQEPRLRGAEDNRFFPHDPAFGISQVL